MHFMAVVLLSVCITDEDDLKRARLPEDAADKARTQVVGVLKQSKAHNHQSTPSESKALREQCSDDGLMILPADKGRTTVVMDKTVYDAKVVNMLSDTSNYLQASPYRLYLCHPTEDELPTLLSPQVKPPLRPPLPQAP